MGYYEYFSLKEEPFSSSPDPFYFWLSQSHKTVLYRLQVSIKLKRGLSVVLGDIGTGKTTLSRTLFQELNHDQIDFHPIFTPYARTNSQFIRLLLQAFKIESVSKNTGYIQNGLSAIESHLLKRGLEEGKTIVLLIDEAQNLNAEAFEILRALLNFESHREKLLQVVLLGQSELLPKLIRTKNLWDRVILKQVLRPLTQIETEKLIDFRLQRAGCEKPFDLFLPDACSLIHEISNGFPRQITRLAHDALEFAVMREKTKIDRDLIQELVNEEQRFFETAQVALSKTTVESSEVRSPSERVLDEQRNG